LPVILAKDRKSVTWKNIIVIIIVIIIASCLKIYLIKWHFKHCKLLLDTLRYLVLETNLKINAPGAVMFTTADDIYFVSKVINWVDKLA
jgi:hypothetical protein